MFKFKKVISTVVSSTIALGLMMPVSAFNLPEDVKDTKFAEAASVLGALEIMIGDDMGNFRPDDTVSRAEFAKIAVHTLGLENVAESSKDVSKFPDVSTDYWANGYINVAAAQGLIIGDDDGNYRPSDGISYQEACTILVRLLGYEPVALTKGAYPTGYLVQANDLGLTKKAAAASLAGCSRGITAQLTYNALTVNLMEATGFGSDIQYEIVDKTVLEDKLGVEKKTGVVTGNSITRLSSKTGVADDQVEIGEGNLFYVGSSKADRLLGYYVTYYVKTDDNDDKTIILAQADENKNSELIINANDLEEEIKENDQKIVYRPDEDSKPETAELDEKYKVIYNDKFATALKNPATGTVKLLDTNRDDKYDVVFINEYVNYVIDDVSTVSLKVYDKYEQSPLSLDNKTNKNLKVILEDMNGNDIKIEDLKEWDVLSVYKNTDYVRAVLSRDTVNGVISERSEADTIIGIDGVEYEVAENIKYADLTLDLEGEFLLDMNGKIAGYNAVSRKGTNYGYLINAGITDSIDSELSLKIFTQNGSVKTFTAANKIKIDEKSGFEAKDALKELKNGNETVTPVIVTYNINSDGNINLIDRAENKTSSFPSSFEKDMFALNYKGSGLIYKETSGKLNIVDEDGKVTGSISVNKDTLIFSIPENETDTDNMEMASLSIFSDGSSYDVEVYDMTENMTASVIRVTNTVNVGKIESPIAIVDRITTISNADGDKVDRIYVMENGEYKALTTEETDTLYKNETTKLEAGDVIQYTTNAKGEIDKFTLLYEMKNKGTEFTKTYGNDNEMVIAYGKVTKKFNDSINVSVNGGTAINYSTKDAVVYKYNANKSTNKTSVVDAGEITKWETETNEVRVLIREYKDKVQEIFIIEA